MKSREIEISKSAIFWSYLSQILNTSSGLIVLPFVLTMLSAEEVGLNYLMLSVGSLVSLIDFGFSPQFSRNVSYVYSGAKNMEKKGLNLVTSLEIDYHLVLLLIKTAKWIYRIMAIFSFLILITLGTWYILHVTNQTLKSSYILLIWGFFSLSMFFQIYYSYYRALLIGSGSIIQANKCMIFSTIFKIVLTLILLWSGWGLLGLVIANLLYPFIGRILAHFYYFTADFKQKIAPYQVTYKEIRNLFEILWYNSKKLGLSSVAGFLTYSATTLLIGIYLSLEDVGSYGLMNQAFTLINTAASLLFVTYQPRFASLLITQNIQLLNKEFSFSVVVYQVLFIVGLIVMIIFAPMLLSLIGSVTILPSSGLLLIFGIIRLLDGNFVNMVQIFVLNNEMPFLKASIITSVSIVVMTFFLLFMDFGIWGVVLAVGSCQLAYNDWYWVRRSFKFLKMKPLDFEYNGVKEIINKINKCK